MQQIHIAPSTWGAEMAKANDNATELYEFIAALQAMAMLPSVRAVYTGGTIADGTNDVINAPAVVDGVTLVAGDRVLHATGGLDGIFTVITPGTLFNGTWTRAIDMRTGTVLKAGVSVYAREGTANGRKIWNLRRFNDTGAVGANIMPWGNDAGIPAVEKDQPSGVATLGADRKLLSSQIPDSLLAGLKWQGTWNASTNAPAIAAAATANNGFFYRVDVAGTSNVTGTSVAFGIGDWLISNGTAWQRVPNTLPLVDDLTTGGASVALSAEQGKALKALVDSKAAIGSTAGVAASAAGAVGTADTAARSDHAHPFIAPTWAIANAYKSSALVRYTDNLIYMANADIAANTAWATGTSGATWRQQTQASAATSETLDIGTYKQASAQSLPDNVDTKITGLTTVLNASTQWNAANNRFVITKAGTYNIRGRVSFASNSAGSRQAFIRKNGTTMATGSCAASGAGTVTAEMHTTLVLAVNDTIELWGWHNTGAALNTVVSTTGHFSELEIIQLPTTTSVTPSTITTTNAPTAGQVPIAINGTQATWSVYLPQWVQANSYIQGERVMMRGIMVEAVAAIPAATAFVYGTTGAVWKPVLEATMNWRGVYTKGASYADKDVFVAGSWWNAPIFRVSASFTAASGRPTDSDQFWTDVMNVGGVGVSACSPIINNANGVHYGEYVLVGATATAEGRQGFVPKPLSAARNQFLSGAGGWTTPLIGSTIGKRRNVVQTVTTGSNPTVLFDSDDTFGSYNAGSSGLTYDSGTGKFTNNTGRRGVWQVSYVVSYQAGNSSGNRLAWVQVAGDAGNRFAQDIKAGSDNNDPILNGSATICLDDGGFFEIKTFQDSGASRDIGAGIAGQAAGYSVRVQACRMFH